MIVGHVLGPVMLGYYLLAFNVSSWIPGMISTAVLDSRDDKHGRTVCLDPRFLPPCEIDLAALAIGARKSITLMVTEVTPLAVGIAALAVPLVSLLYGSDGMPSSAPLRFLAVVVVAPLLTTLALGIQTSLGRTGVTVWVNTAWVAALVPALFLGVQLGGTAGYLLIVVPAAERQRLTAQLRRRLRPT